MKKKEERRGPTLFDFVQSKKEEKKPARPESGRDVVEEFYHLVKDKKRVSKEEAARWAKERGISTADLIKAVERLVAEKKIRKKLDDEGNLIYEAYG